MDYSNEVVNMIIEIKRYISKNRSSVIEFLFWFVSAALLSFPILAEIWYYGSISFSTYREYSGQVISSFSFVIIPVIFAFVFGNLPINHMRAKNLEAKNKSSDTPNKAPSKINYNIVINSANPSDADSEIARVKELIENHEVNDNSNPAEKVVNFIKDMMLASTELAQRMLRNASLYLFMGMIIALGGLVFFYTLTLTSTASADSALSSSMLHLAPKFGILFFIEFIAFFFLKQYRTCMDEFRYYESLKRSREETYAIVCLMMLDGEKINVLELIEKYGFRTKADKLEAGQSYDHLEARKLDNSQLEILGKIVEGIVKK